MSVPGLDQLDTLLLVALAAALGWASGLRLYAVLFVVGASRARVGSGRWWTNGLEMLALGAIVGAVAYSAGAGVAAVVTDR